MSHISQHATCSTGLHCTSSRFDSDLTVSISRLYCDVGAKYATGGRKIKNITGMENISVGSWNVRTLKPAVKHKELTYIMGRYRWNILGLPDALEKVWLEINRRWTQ